MRWVGFSFFYNNPMSKAISAESWTPWTTWQSTVPETLQVLLDSPSLAHEKLKAMWYTVFLEEPWKMIVWNDTLLMVIEDGRLPSIFRLHVWYYGEKYNAAVAFSERGDIRFYNDDWSYIHLISRWIRMNKESENKEFRTWRDKTSVLATDLTAHWFQKVQDLGSGFSVYRREWNKDIDQSEWSFWMKQWFAWYPVEVIVRDWTVLSVVRPYLSREKQFFTLFLTQDTKFRWMFKETRPEIDMNISLAEEKEYAKGATKAEVDEYGITTYSFDWRDRQLIYWEWTGNWEKEQEQYYTWEYSTNHFWPILQSPLGKIVLSDTGDISLWQTMLNFEIPLSRELLGIQDRVPQCIDGFDLYGVNHTDVLRTLQPTWEIDFFSEWDGSIELLMKDNAYVLHGWLTHQQIAEPMKYIHALYEKTRLWYWHQTSPKKFKHENGNVYEMQVTEYAWGTRTYTIIREDGVILSFHSDMVDVIEKFWWYWWNSVYKTRIPPQKIIDFFAITPSIST